MKTMKWMMTLATVSFLAAGCTNTADKTDTTDEKDNQPVTVPAGEANSGANDSGGADSEKNETEKPPASTDKNDSQSSEESVADEQKQMALDTLKGLVKDAKEGKVYAPDQGFYVGKTSREEVYDTIGKPEEKSGGFDKYHGSMGNPSIAFAYDDKGVIKEARYFGTTVERQTNLGGITEKDLHEQLGEPADTHTIEATGETNIRYHLGDFDLQFIIGKDGTPDHVNLKEWK